MDFRYQKEFQIQASTSHQVRKVVKRKLLLFLRLNLVIELHAVLKESDFARQQMGIRNVTHKVLTARSQCNEKIRGRSGDFESFY